MSPSAETGPTAHRRRIAVVGAGVSGLTAAYLLRQVADITLLEAEARLGGHVDSHDVRLDQRAAVSAPTTRVDSGFIVCNDRTYPMLLRLFDELGVDIVPTRMSMSVHCDGCGLEFAGGLGVGGVFAQRRRIADPRFWRLLLEIRRFQRAAKSLLLDPADEACTLGEFLVRERFSRFFIQHYAVPVVSCVWSSGHADALGYPAAYLFRFLDQHGFLTLGDAPQWFTVAGGSAAYVDVLADRLRADGAAVVARTPVTSVGREDAGVRLRSSALDLGRFDQVVIATHADDALALLADPTTAEKEVLGAFGSSENEVVVHRDAAILPHARAARAAWNLRIPDCSAEPDRVRVDYWMNALQHLDARFPALVSLNPDHPVPDELVIARRTYTHPVFSSAARAAQRRLGELSTGTTTFAGAYHGWGFHEDGCRSGVAAAQHFGATW